MLLENQQLLNEHQTALLFNLVKAYHKQTNFYFYFRLNAADLIPFTTGKTPLISLIHPRMVGLMRKFQGRVVPEKTMSL